LDYAPAPTRRPLWRSLVSVLSLFLLVAAILAALAAIDGIFNEHSDFVPLPWCAMSIALAIFPVWWIVVDTRHRRRVD
jgi:hypothetical protein